MAKAAKSSSEHKRINREIHALMWRANWQDPFDLIMCYLLRLPAFFAGNIAIPILSAKAIQAIVERNMQHVQSYALQVLLMAGVYVVLWAMAAFFITRNAVRGSIYLQNRVFANYLQKDYEFYSNNFLGAIGAQASRIRETYNSYCVLMTLTIPKQVVIVIAGTTVIGMQSRMLAIVTIGSMIAVLGYTIQSSNWRQKYRRRLGESNSDIAGVIGDSLSQAHTIKSFASEHYELQRLQPKLLEWARIQKASWLSALPADVGRAIMTALATAVLLVLSAKLYIEGSISIAIVALIQLYVLKLVAATLDISQIINTYEENMASAYQPVQTMLVKSGVLDPVTPQKPADSEPLHLELANLSFRYPDSPPTAFAVKDVSLHIQPGEKIGIVGYSGSGKTTLTKLLLRFMDASQGAIKLQDIDIRDLLQQDLRQQIAYVPQEPLLFHRSIYDNIAYGDPSASKKAVLAAAKAAYVDEFVDVLPQKYDTFVGERGIKLSGGQRQRVSIARAILRNAPILILDEATSALDSNSEKLIQDALWKLMDGRTAIVVAHRLSTIQKMDRIAVMDKGKIIELGTHQQLLKSKSGIYAQLWSHQSGGYIGASHEVGKE